MSGTQVIIPNLNHRFSGITSTVARVLPHQAKELNIVSVGHPLPCEVPHLSWKQIIQLTASPLSNGKPRIFHARRNNEMLAGLILKHLLRRQLHLIFTSTAQRHHSSWTRFLYRKMDTLLSTSPRAASYLNRKPDAIIPHGVDLNIYHPADDRAGAWQDSGLPGRYGIGIFGRIRPQKGLSEFVHALCRVLPQHPEFTAVIIGETTPKFQPFVQQLKRHIAARGLQDRFCWPGKLPFSEIPLWFRRMSLVACVPHNEGFGLTCLEAMASAVPVIATRTGAFEMIIREGLDGSLVPCANTDALEQAFRSLLNQGPARLDKMGHAARSHICASFSIEQEAHALNEVYRSILSPNHVAPIS